MVFTENLSWLPLAVRAPGYGSCQTHPHVCNYTILLILYPTYFLNTLCFFLLLHNFYDYIFNSQFSDLLQFNSHLAL